MGAADIPNRLVSVSLRPQIGRVSMVSHIGGVILMFADCCLFSGVYVERAEAAFWFLSLFLVEPVVAGNALGSSCLCLPNKHWGYEHVLPSLTFT